jgi:hypothetical protein
MASPVIGESSWFQPESKDSQGLALGLDRITVSGQKQFGTDGRENPSGAFKRLGLFALDIHLDKCNRFFYCVVQLSQINLYYVFLENIWHTA